MLRNALPDVGSDGGGDRGERGGGGVGGAPHRCLRPLQVRLQHLRESTHALVYPTNIHNMKY